MDCRHYNRPVLRQRTRRLNNAHRRYTNRRHCRCWSWRGRRNLLQSRKGHRCICYCLCIRGPGRRYNSHLHTYRQRSRHCRHHREQRWPRAGNQAVNCRHRQCRHPRHRNPGVFLAGIGRLCKRRRWYTRRHLYREVCCRYGRSPSQGRKNHRCRGSHHYSSELRRRSKSRPGNSRRKCTHCHRRRQVLHGPGLGRTRPLPTHILAAGRRHRYLQDPGTR